MPNSSDGLSREATAFSDAHDEALLAHQLKRTPRKPWRVAARCSYGAPMVIVSPSLLEDGSRFPNWAYLTCPHAVREISTIESEGGISEYNALLDSNNDAKEGRFELDAQLRSARARECARYGQEDVCAEVGIAGQHNIYAVKCLHIHAAYYLLGLQDDIGADLFNRIQACPLGAPCGGVQPLAAPQSHREGPPCA